MQDETETEMDMAQPDDAPQSEQIHSALVDENGLPARRASGVLGVPIEVMISVGKSRPLVSELVNLRRDSVLPLDSRIDDPVEIYIGDRLIARGELQEMEGEEGRLGVRLTEIEDLSNGV